MDILRKRLSSPPLTPNLDSLVDFYFDFDAQGEFMYNGQEGTVDLATIYVPDASTSPLPAALPPVPSTSTLSSFQDGVPVAPTTASSSGERPKLASSGRKPKRRSCKSYYCPECGDETSSLKRLGEHMRDVHSMKAFKCDNCETRVARYDNLESHKRSCKQLPVVGSSPATLAAGLNPQPSSSKTKNVRRQRVSLRNLKPVPIQTMPRPTSYTETERIGPSAPSLPQNDESNTQLQLDTPLPSETHDVSISFSDHSTSTVIDWELEVRTLRIKLTKTLEELAQVREQLEQASIDRDAWRNQYHYQLKSGGTIRAQ